VSDRTAEVTDLLQQLIRNGCVNDGTRDSGQEVRNADLLETYLAGSGVDQQRFEIVPGRPSLVSRLEGSDPSAPTLLLMGHTDVVPVNADGWRRDPFGAELFDGEVWGRGAVDMLNLTSSMAVAVNAVARSGFRPRGTLIYFAVPDEEASGIYGAKYMTEEEPDAVRADYVVTEMGGFRFATAGPPKLVLMAAEKGTYWCRIRVRGTPGHGSMPLRTDNALVKAAEIVRRLAAYEPRTQVHETWERFVNQMDFPDDLSASLLDPGKIRALAEETSDLGLARMIHACTHTTFAPTVMHAGVKSNVIPDYAEIQVDIRTLPGQTGADIEAMLAEALGEHYADVEIDPTSAMDASASPVDTPLYDTLTDLTERLLPGTTTVPFIIVGATDARYFRKMGAVSYGYGLFSERIPYTEFAKMFHGDDERIDVESLRLSTELWEALIREFLA
jgi:acetylornithine deacetylase/succinyl-diaminopimelate desuccinylase-like protein